MQSFKDWMEQAQPKGISNKEMLAAVKKAIDKYSSEWDVAAFYHKKPTEYKKCDLSAGRMFELLDPDSREEVRKWAKKEHGIDDLARP